MDYLSFGLLAGSLIVIASFVVRDGLPHLSAVPRGSRLDRLSRAETPRAWGRWCADAGLVLAAAGTLVLLLTVATLLAGPSDGVGNVAVGLGVAAAVVVSILGSARLAQRLRGESEAELAGDFETVSLRPMATIESAAVADTAPTMLTRPTPARTATPATAVAAASVTPEPAVSTPDVWDDDLPTWAGAGSSSPTEAVVSEARFSSDVAPAVPDVAPEDASARSDLREPEQPPSTGSGGLFSSPLLADIGLALDEDENEGGTGFRSPLLSGLHEQSGEVTDRDAVGADVLIDETPAPIQASGRPRDEAEER